MRVEKIFYLLFLFLFGSVQSYSQTWEWTERVRDNGNSRVLNNTVDLTDSSIYSTGRVKEYGVFGENTNPQYPIARGDRDIFFTKHDYNGNLLWVKRYGGKKKDWGSVIEASSSNLYMGGWYQDTCYFENDTLIANGIDNCFLAKSDTSGNIQWIKSYGLAGNNFLNGSYINEDEEIYLVGEFTDSIQFDTTVLVNTKRPIYSSSRSGFIAKIDSGGNCLWSKKFLGSYRFQLFDVIEDNENSIYVVGQFSGSSCHLNDTLEITSSALDPIIIKLDSLGNILWYDNPSGSGWDSFERVVVDDNNDIVVSGKFINQLTVNSDSTLYSYNSQTSNGIIFKYNSEGTMAEVLLQIPSYGGSDLSALDYINNRIYFGGFIMDTTYIQSDTIFPLEGSMDLFFGALDLSDNSLWYDIKGSEGNDYLLSLSTLDNERIILGGKFRGTVDFETVQFSSIGNRDDALISAVSPPIKAIIYSEDNVTYCQNDTIILNNLSIGSIDSVEWIVNNATIISSLNERLELLLPDSGIVNVLLVATNETEIDSVIVELEVKPLPIIVFPTDTFFCVGSNVELNLGSEYYSYLWNSGDVDSMIVVDEEGIYSVMVSSEFGCSSVHSTSVIEQTPPTINLGIDTTLCDGETIELSAGEYFNTYLWSTGDTTSTIIIETEAIYSVIAWDSLACQSSDSINVSIDICDNVAHYHKNNSFKIYPNPFSDYFEINSDLNISYSVSVYNNLNQRVFVKEFVNSKITIHTQEFNSGVYFIIIENDDHEIYHYKLVKL